MKKKLTRREFVASAVAASALAGAADVSVGAQAEAEVGVDASHAPLIQVGKRRFLRVRGE